jgi:hypothetical protein
MLMFFRCCRLSRYAIPFQEQPPNNDQEVPKRVQVGQILENLGHIFDREHAPGILNPDHEYGFRAGNDLHPGDDTLDVHTDEGLQRLAQYPIKMGVQCMERKTYPLSLAPLYASRIPS